MVVPVQRKGHVAADPPPQRIDEAPVPMLAGRPARVVPGRDQALAPATAQHAVEPQHLPAPRHTLQVAVQQQQPPWAAQTFRARHRPGKDCEKPGRVAVRPVMIARHRQPPREHRIVRLMALEQALASRRRVGQIADLDQPGILEIALPPHGRRHLRRSGQIAIARVADDVQDNGGSCKCATANQQHEQGEDGIHGRSRQSLKHRSINICSSYRGANNPGTRLR